MDINDIEQVTVVYKSGRKVTYKKRGLEKLRIEMKKSPPLGKSGEVIEDSESDSEPEMLLSPGVASGYKVGGFSYDVSSAEALRAEAEKQGLQFS